MASTFSVTAHLSDIHGATERKNLPPFSISLCKLNSCANIVDMKIFSHRGCQKLGLHHKYSRVHALFGGKKENNALFICLLFDSIFILGFMTIGLLVLIGEWEKELLGEVMQSYTVRLGCPL